MAKKLGKSLIFAVAALFGDNLAAVEVYQWTDENGVVHFSQWAPDEDVRDVETVSVKGGAEADNGLGISEEDDPDGYQAHREEMDALWNEIEERRKVARTSQDAAPVPEIIFVGSEPDYAMPYYPPGLRPFPRPRPDHRPGDGPGHRPGRPGDRPGNGDEDNEGRGPPVRSVPFRKP